MRLRLRSFEVGVEYAPHWNAKGTAMKFGGIHLMGLPRPWNSESEHTLLSDALDLAELSDQCGFDYVWGTEHHFLEEYSHSSRLRKCSSRPAASERKMCGSRTESSKRRRYQSSGARGGAYCDARSDQQWSLRIRNGFAELRRPNSEDSTLPSKRSKRCRSRDSAWRSG